MEDVNFLEQLFDAKTLRILKLFLRDSQSTYYLREVSKLTGVSLASTYRILNRILKLNIIEQVQIKRFKVYKLASNKRVDFLEQFLKEEKRILESFVDQIRTHAGIQAVILHGDAQPDRANVLLIGENIDTNELKRLCAEVKEKYNFTISPLTLTQEQFNQMSSMGLYSGKKKVLFKK